jgi:hypothetical protein
MAAEIFDDTRFDLAGKQALAIRDGRGGVYLELTERQYRKLREL